MTLEEPTGYREDAELVEEAEEAEIGTDQDLESDLDEEEILEKAKEGDILSEREGLPGDSRMQSTCY